MEIEMIKVTSGNSISGYLQVEGAKNSALFLISAALMSDEEVIIKNIPNITDIENLLLTIGKLGVEYEYCLLTRNLTINAPTLKTCFVDFELARKIRGSIALVCPLLYKQKKAILPYPGGDKIGKRPIDELLKGLKKMGVDYYCNNDILCFERKQDLNGITYELEYPSHTATIGLMMMGSVAKGLTTLKNVALEPEVLDMQKFLKSMGVNIKGAGTNTIFIEGREALKKGFIEVMPDRLQIGTYILANLITEGSLRMPVTYFNNLECLIELIKCCGAGIKYYGNDVIISGKRPYNSISFETQPYPGFPTDLQAPMIAFLATCDGESYVKENVFENRLLHIPELNRLGANIEILTQREVYIKKAYKFNSGLIVNAYDIRGGAALLLYSLYGKNNITYIRNIHHLKRGYPNIVELLASLGVNINYTEES